MDSACFGKPSARARAAPSGASRAAAPGGKDTRDIRRLKVLTPSALANNAKLTLHVRVEAGTNAHHMVEAAFKAFARALRAAVAIDPGATGVPSTKGLL